MKLLYQKELFMNVVNPNVTVRNVFIIDDKGIVRAILMCTFIIVTQL